MIYDMRNKNNFLINYSLGSKESEQHVTFDEIDPLTLHKRSKVNFDIKKSNML